MANGKGACAEVAPATGEVCALVNGLPAVHAVTVGAKNAKQTVGASFRWCKDFAQLHGVPIYRNGRTPLIDAAKLFAAIEKHGMECPASKAATREEQTRAVLRDLGWETVK